MTIPSSIIAEPGVQLSHHKIHEGPFVMSQIVSTNLQIANPKYILLFSRPAVIPPTNTLFIHLIYSVSSSLGITTEFFEDPTFSDKGTPVAAFFNNRNFGVVAPGGQFENPTVISDGTRLYIERIGSTITGGKGGPRNRDEDETILKLNTFYLIKVTPLVDGVDITIKTNAYSNRAAPVPPFT